MAHIKTSIVIRRPQDETFAYLTDPRNAKDWSSELVDVTYNGDLTEGTSGADTRRMGRKKVVMPWIVTATRAHRLRVRAPIPRDRRVLIPRRSGWHCGHV